MRFTIPLVVLVGVACGGATADGDAGAPDASRTDASVGDGATPDLFSCNAPGECDVRPKSCCGVCGAPTLKDMIGVNWQKGSAYAANVCGPSANCPECAQLADPNLAPVCRAKQCLAVDVRVDSALSACKQDVDCSLRYAGCCEPCGVQGPEALIALSSAGRGEYVANQCHPDAGGCPKCAVQYPPTFAARCNPSTLHCEVIPVAVDAGGG
jgi:hypothetical protein